MDFGGTGVDLLSMTSLPLLLMVDTHKALDFYTSRGGEDEVAVEDDLLPSTVEAAFSDEDVVSCAVLNHFRLYTSLHDLDEDLGYWVKPRSTTWFPRFLLEEYADERWIHMFRMTKRTVLSLSQLLSPLIQRRDTNYWLAVPVTVRVACALFKLSHGTSLLICSKLFAVGRGTVSLILRDVVHAINVGLRSELRWPWGDFVQEVALGFQQTCGLPGVVGAIGGMHFAIAKPKVGAAGSFNFKSGSCSMHCQVVMDSNKRFLDINVGMLDSTNDSRVLRRSSLYHRGQHGMLWDAGISFNSFSPYLIGDSGYPLLPWLMVLHRDFGNLSTVEALFNARLSKGRVFVENAFATLKQTFRELHQKSKLDVSFLLDVVFTCVILHNMLIQQSHDKVEMLLHILQAEAEIGEHDRHPRPAAKEFASCRGQAT